MVPEVHYRIHNSPPSIPMLSQIIQAHATPSHCLNVRFNIILPSMPGSSKWSFSLRFPHQNPVCTSPFLPTCHITPLPHLILLDLFTRMIFGEQCRLLSTSTCSFLHSSFASFLLVPHTFLNTLFSNTLSIVPPSMSETKFHTLTKRQAKL